MATRKNYLGKPTYRFLTVERENNPFNSEPLFEFDESNLWNSNHVDSSNDHLKRSTLPTSRNTKKPSKRVENGDRMIGGTAKSLPMNVPDWSKILRDDRRVNGSRGFNDYVEGDDDEDDDDEGIIPPHEYLARQLGRTQISSFSVHEGIGRTLKGRDLSRVRDAIWEKTGFED